MVGAISDVQNILTYNPDQEFRIQYFISNICSEMF